MLITRATKKFRCGKDHKLYRNALILVVRVVYKQLWTMYHIAATLTPCKRRCTAPSSLSYFSQPRQPATNTDLALL